MIVSHAIRFINLADENPLETIFANLKLPWMDGKLLACGLELCLWDGDSSTKLQTSRNNNGTFIGDLKDNGFDLESTRLHTVQHLQRLTLAVMLLYLDLVANGARVIKNGQRQLVDHLKRRDLSIFRIGLYFRERRLANDLPFTIRLLPLIC